jgi:hypothetical protein
MKYILTVAILFLVALNSTMAETPALAQTPRTPEATVRRFYQWYVHALNQNVEPLEKHQAEMGKFVTARLMGSLTRALKRPDGIDADYFLDAQDWDEMWEHNISTSKARIQGERATINVTLNGNASFGNHKLRVRLRKEGGAWKIDSINGRANP